MSSSSELFDSAELALASYALFPLITSSKLTSAYTGDLKDTCMTQTPIKGVVTIIF